MVFSKKGDRTYTVTLLDEAKGSRTTIEVAEQEFILDAAEAQGVDIAYCCRTGACTVCTGRIVQGYLDQSSHCFLKDNELKAGFALLCAASPQSDCTIKINQEDELYKL